MILGELTDPVINGCIDQHSEISGTVKLSAETQVIHSYIEGPTDIGAGTLIKNSTNGPFTSIGNNCTIQETTLSNCVILDNAQIIGINGIEDSIVGRSSVIKSQSDDTKSVKLMVGDDNEVLL